MKAFIACLALPLLLVGSLAHAQTHTTPKKPTTGSGAKPAARPATTTAPKPAAPKPAAKPAPATTGKAPVLVVDPLNPRVRVEMPGTSTNNPMTVGATALNIGLGFGSAYNYYGYGYYGSLSSSSSFPALTVSLMHGAKEVGPGVISLGGIIGYQRYSWDYSGYRGAWQDFAIGGRAAYHYNFDIPDLDLYAGAGLTVLIESYSDNSGGNYDYFHGGTYAHISTFLGARYYFSPKLGGFLETGYDVTYLKFGVSAKL